MPWILEKFGIVNNYYKTKAREHEINGYKRGQKVSIGTLLLL